jgi:hypothetical protein
VLDTDLLDDRQQGTITGPEAAMLVPSTLQASLMARLDRLGDAKAVAQVAAVIGREFPFVLVGRLSAVVPDRLPGLLAELASAGLIAVHGHPPEATYAFRHSLIQDAAYESLLRDRRRRLHLRLAELLEQDPATDARPEVLAHHCAEGASPIRPSTTISRRLRVPQSSGRCAKWLIICATGCGNSAVCRTRCSGSAESSRCRPPLAKGWPRWSLATKRATRPLNAHAS